MTQKTDNQPEFPTNTSVDVGLTMRDFFAAAALTGMVSNGYIPASDDNSGREFAFTNADYARKAYGLADAMLEERLK